MDTAVTGWSSLDILVLLDLLLLLLFRNQTPTFLVGAWMNIYIISDSTPEAMLG